MTTPEPEATARQLTPTVYIVDDDASAHHALAKFCQSLGHNVLSFSSAEEFLQNVQRPQLPGCLIVDLNLGGMDGIELLETIRRQRSDCPVVAISAYADVPLAVRVMQLGASTLLEKSAGAEALSSAIAVAVSASYDAIARRQLRTKLQHLTGQELLTLDLMAAGMPNKRIAQEMGLSLRTVDRNRARLLDKTGRGTTAELIRDVSTLKAIDALSDAARAPCGLEHRPPGLRFRSPQSSRIPPQRF